MIMDEGTEVVIVTVITDKGVAGGEGGAVVALVRKMTVCPASPNGTGAQTALVSKCH